MLQLIVLIVLLNPAACASVEQVNQTKPCGLLDYLYQISISGIRRFMNNVLKHIPNYNIGPKKSNEYDPNLGYELYWPDAEWVFKPPAVEKNDDVCGERCDALFKSYGPVCGRNKKLITKTFENYCKMKEIDCDNHQGWLISYRGKCATEIRTFPTRSKLIAPRARQWEKDFYKKYARLLRTKKK